MRRKFGIGAGVIGALVVTTGIAMAAITFHSGPTVTFTADGASATFNVSGLGNEPAKATLDLSGSATWGCRNHGKNVAPGHPETLATGSASQVFQPSAKNGRATVTVSATLTPPEKPTPQQIGCPNPAGNWEVYLVSESVTKATLTIEQPIGTVIFGPKDYTP